MSDFKEGPEPGELSIVIWTFHTATGSVRLQLGVSEDRREDLRSELEGCATVAEHVNEFLDLATRAIGNHGGMLGDVLRQTPALDALEGAIAEAAKTADPFVAADALVAALEVAPAASRARLLRSAAMTSARRYVNDLLVSLDEHGSRYAQRIAELLGVDTEELSSVLSS